MLDNGHTHSVDLCVGLCKDYNECYPALTKGATITTVYEFYDRGPGGRQQTATSSLCSAIPVDIEETPLFIQLSSGQGERTLHAKLNVAVIVK
jgi:hypothetical protein